MSILSRRPSPTHKLAILFPETEIKPLLTWVSCDRETSSEDGGYGMTYETSNLRSLLGKDNPALGRVHIEYNAKRDRSLGCGKTSWAPMKEGYSIQLAFRDAFSVDGSTINRSLIESVKTSGTVHYKWCGPIVAMRQTGMISTRTSL
jgi:hypothetical protein